ncbi:hypothetical protein IW136_003394, partial [Coemansia sp. RSA 678]
QHSNTATQRQQAGKRASGQAGSGQRAVPGKRAAGKRASGQCLAMGSRRCWRAGSIFV